MSAIRRVKVPGEKGIWRRGKRFEVAVLIGTVQGKKRYQWATVKTLPEARRKRAELMTGAARGEIAWDSKMPFKTLIEKWLDISRVDTAPRTWENYAHIVQRHLIPWFKEKKTPDGPRLRDIQPSMIQDYISEKMNGGRLDGEAGGLSPKTLLHHYTLLHLVFEYAVEKGLIARNPCQRKRRGQKQSDKGEKVRLPDVNRPELTVLESDDLNRVLAEAKRRYPYLYPLLLTLLSTGLRRSETLGLRWRDLDFSQNQLQVTRTMHHLRTGETVFRWPKTEKSRRNVALPAQCALVLRAYKEQRERERDVLGYQLSPDDPVFADDTGKIYLPDTVTHVWGKLMKRLGLKVRLHDGRHTHVSHLISLGVDIKTISERVGHASVAFTLDTYGHLLKNAQAKAAARFDEVLVLDRPEVLTPDAPTQEAMVAAD